MLRAIAASFFFIISDKGILRVLMHGKFIEPNREVFRLEVSFTCFTVIEICDYCRQYTFFTNLVFKGSVGRSVFFVYARELQIDRFKRPAVVR